MHRRLIELEYIRVLLKYLGTGPVSSSVLVHGVRATQVPAVAYRQLVPVHFCSRQTHSFLYLAMCLRGAQSRLIPFLFLVVRNGTGANQLLR
jgi:hypothetical protein